MSSPTEQHSTPPDATVLRPLASAATLPAEARGMPTPTKSTLVPRVTAGLAVCAALTALGLSRVHVGTADVEIDVAASQLSFVVDEQGPLTRAVEIQSLRLRNVATLRVPNFRGAPEATIRTAEVALSSADTTARISIDALDADSGAHVALTLPVQNRLSLGLRASRLSRAVHLTVVTPVILTTGERVDTLRYPGARALTAMRVNDTIEALVTFPDTTASLFSGIVGVGSLELSRVNGVGAASSSSAPREESTLRSVRLRLTGYDTPTAVNRAEVVKLAIARNGRLRDLRVTPNGIEASFAGTLSALTVGGRQAMPSQLERFANDLHIRLLYAAAVFMFSILGGLYAWWRSAR